jgi:hypothetical protein
MNAEYQNAPIDNNIEGQVPVRSRLFGMIATRRYNKTFVAAYTVYSIGFFIMTYTAMNNSASHTECNKSNIQNSYVYLLLLIVSKLIITINDYKRRGEPQIFCSKWLNLFINILYDITVISYFFSYILQNNSCLDLAVRITFGIFISIDTFIVFGTAAVSILLLCCACFIIPIMRVLGVIVDVQNGAPEQVITNIPERDYVVIDNAESCTICLDDFNEKDKVRTLPCKHEFHTKCIDPWLRINKTCPNCRQDVNGQNQMQLPGQIV